jgi:F0F1-type ATP synthase assembly protein I
LEAVQVATPDDRERQEREEEGLSNLALAYRKAGPYLAASTSLVASVGVFAGLGYWADQKLHHGTPWLLLVGAAVGMTGGFISFFKTVLGQKDK